MLFANFFSKHEPVSRLIEAHKIGLGTNSIMIEVGPTKLTVGDLWTLIPPDVARRHNSETKSLKNFRPGWLIDKVITSLMLYRIGIYQTTVNRNRTCVYHRRINRYMYDQLLSPSIIFPFQVIEAAMWKLSLQYDVFSADTTLAQIAGRGSSTRLLWSGLTFTTVSKIFIPINDHGIHWTLLVRMDILSCDKLRQLFPVGVKCDR